MFKIVFVILIIATACYAVKEFIKWRRISNAQESLTQAQLDSKAMSIEKEAKKIKQRIS